MSSPVIYEPMNCLEVSTPKGNATIWLVTDYGIETAKLFTCIISATGEVWEFLNKDVKVRNNQTIGRISKK